MLQLIQWWWAEYISGAPNATVPVIDAILAAFLGAIQIGTVTLSTYSWPLLLVAATLHYRFVFMHMLVRGGGMLGDTFGEMVFMCVSLGFYMWFLQHLVPITDALLTTFIGWGVEASGGQFAPPTLRTPSLIMQAGLDAAGPLVAFDTFWRGLKSTYNLLSDPWLFVAAVVILAAFGAITLHFAMMVVEFYLAVLASGVLIPLAVWRVTSELGEFAAGWVIGGLVRAFISCTLIGIAVPLFQLLVQPQAGVPLIPDSLMVALGAALFGVLAFVVPGRAASMVGRASLHLTGSTVVSAAMTTARFGMMGRGAVRGVSRMVQRLGA